MLTMRLFRLIGLFSLTLVLAGCAGGMPKSVFPPRASVQQLSVQPDGSWKLQLRLQNYSFVAMTFDKVIAKISVSGNPAGDLSMAPALRIGPQSADIVEANLRPSPAAASAVAELRGTGSVRYRLSGRIVTSDPSRDQEYTFEGVLSPVPGLPGVLR
jgi:hypothetical protein